MYTIFFRSIYLVVLKICRFVLCVMGQVLTRLYQSINNELLMGSSSDNEHALYRGVDVLNECDNTLALMKEAFSHVPNPNLDYTLRNVTSELAKRYIDKIASGCETVEALQSAINSSLSKFMPTMEMVWTTIQLTWAMAGANQHLFDNHLNNTDLHDHLNEKSLELEDINGMILLQQIIYYWIVIL